MKIATLHKKNRQDGMALMLAIGLLAILSVLGALIMDVSTRDLSGSAATLPNLRAFQTADRAVEYAMNRDLLVNLSQYNSVNLLTDLVVKSDGSTLAGVTHKAVIESTGVGKLVSGAIEDLGPHNIPPALASKHGSEFGANLYHINVKTEAGVGPLTRTTHVDANIVRLFKMDDDQIFRTSEGG